MLTGAPHFALQFEVVQYRMKDEYGVDTTLEPLNYSIARCAGFMGEYLDFVRGIVLHSTSSQCDTQKATEGWSTAALLACRC